MVAGLALTLAAVLWNPGDVKLSGRSAAALIAQIRPYETGPQRATYRLNDDGITLEVVAEQRGEDYRLDTDIGSYHYALGRSDGASWRRTPTGTVRIIWSDVQGDDLDRWPRAVFGFYTHDCDLGGETTGATRESVLYCKADGDVAHFYYIDQKSERIDREVTREGSRVVTYRFQNAPDGSLLGWTIEGAGGPATVERISVQVQDIAPSALAIPLSSTGQFSLPISGRVRIPAAFSSGYRITVPVAVNGLQLNFALDTGTTQILMDAGAAKQAGLQPTLGHVVADDVRIGDAAAAKLSVEVVDIFHRAYDGLLGNEFFTGHIVHIDYRNARLELISHAAFRPPAGALAIPIYTDEGMPIVHALFDGAEGERIALDSGGPTMIADAFNENPKLGLPPIGRPFMSGYLEGPIRFSRCLLKSLTFGGVKIVGVPCDLELPEPSNLDISLDGIIGAPELANFDLYFDYDNGALWVTH